jgi:hypothetical protein
VDTVTVAEDVLSHLGVPEAGLVTEVDTGFKHFTHADGHIKTPKVVSKISAYRLELIPVRHLDWLTCDLSCKALSGIYKTR